MNPEELRNIAAVVIGTSAGGVEALGLLLPALDVRCRASVLIVVHLPRQRPSLLEDLFAARCALPIREVVDKQPLEGGSVYFAPPDYHLLVDCEDGVPSLALSVDEPVRFSRPSIDVLFESAAECWKDRLMGVILTGASDDGAQGLAAVARAGGATVVQDPRSAVADALPTAAISTGLAQQVLSLQGICTLFGQLGYPGMNIARTHLPPVKFLLVDDLEDNLLALSALLRESDVEILLARSGAEALELLLVHDVALALLDVQMPEMDGFELAELMRGSERTRHVPIIFVTAGVRDSHRHFRGYEAGAVDFLYKPVDPHILRSKVGVFFQLHRQRQLLDSHVAELSETLRLNEVFAAVLGHDLRNPLNAIVASAHVLQFSKDEMTRSAGQRLINSSRRMARLIEDLLDFSRARLAGGITVQPEPGDLGDLMRRAVQEHQIAAPGRRIELTHEGSLRGQFDGERVAQIASNLLGNALQHGSSGGLVRVHLAGGEKELIRLSVSNAGEIPPQLLGNIFEPFRGRGHGGSARGDGLGLGLYIVQQLAHAHGGEVAVTTGDDMTCFTVTLPRLPAAPPTAPGNTAASQAGQTPP